MIEEEKTFLVAFIISSDVSLGFGMRVWPSDQLSMIIPQCGWCKTFTHTPETRDRRRLSLFGILLVWGGWHRVLSLQVIRHISRHHCHHTHAQCHDTYDVCWPAGDRFAHTDREDKKGRWHTTLPAIVITRASAGGLVREGTLAPRSFPQVVSL